MKPFEIDSPLPPSQTLGDGEIQARAELVFHALTACVFDITHARGFVQNPDFMGADSICEDYLQFACTIEKVLTELSTIKETAHQLAKDIYDSGRKPTPRM